MDAEVLMTEPPGLQTRRHIPGFGGSVFNPVEPGL
jgi:hypothetical protein